VKIVLDSNVLISAFATRGVCADLFREVVATHELILSDYIVTEVREKLSIKFKIPDTTVAAGRLV
jgi:predicted nucleic acid-binding protein